MDKILELLKSQNIVFPHIFLSKYKELELNEKEFILLIYLMNYGGEFNPKQISVSIGYDLKEVLEIINNLCEKGFIDIENKSENNVIREFISLDKLYNKLAFLVLNEKTDVPNNLFSIFEKEFGRQLSPIEIELVNAWKENNYSEELILEALKEAVLNGVSSLRYIDKILYDWNRKGIKNIKKLEETRKNRNEKKQDVFDYDWLNDNE